MKGFNPSHQSKEHDRRPKKDKKDKTKTLSALELSDEEAEFFREIQRVEEGSKRSNWLMGPFKEEGFLRW